MHTSCCIEATGKGRRVELVSRGFRSAECLLEMPFRDRHKDMAAFVEELAKSRTLSMVLPKNAARVAIVDDLPECILTIGGVLAAWPEKVEFEAVLQRYGKPILIPAETNIILLDEKMDELSGETVAAELREVGYRGIIGSTSTSFTAYHDFKFEGKRHLTSGQYGSFVGEFIGFMNGIFSANGFG